MSNPATKALPVKIGDPFVASYLEAARKTGRALWRIRRTIQYRLFEAGFRPGGSLKHCVHSRPDWVGVAV